MIANAGHDENGKYHGGKAGDQTGGEYKIIPWYNRPWTHILRPIRTDVAEVVAEVSENAAKNDNVGYDQYQRLTYNTENAKVGYHPEKIKTPCETDCTASSTEAAISAGHRLNINALKNLSPNTYSGNIVANFKATGQFNVLTDKKYLTSDQYLKRGDILVYHNHHAAVNLTNGSKAGASTGSTQKPATTTTKKAYTGTFPTLPSRGYFKSGDKGTQVKNLQKFLNWAVGSGLSVDGVIGGFTTASVKKFQKAVGITQDGLFGKNSLAKAKAYKK